jgi:hypothetical protein
MRELMKADVCIQYTGMMGSGGSRILIRGGNYRIVMAYRVQIH